VLYVAFLRTNAIVAAALQFTGAGEKTGKLTSGSLCRYYPGTIAYSFRPGGES
jgi:hypothetical protein